MTAFEFTIQVTSPRDAVARAEQVAAEVLGDDPPPFSVSIGTLSPGEIVASATGVEQVSWWEGTARVVLTDTAGRL